MRDLVQDEHGVVCGMGMRKLLRTISCEGYLTYAFSIFYRWYDDSLYLLSLRASRIDVVILPALSPR